MEFSETTDIHSDNSDDDEAQDDNGLTIAHRAAAVGDTDTLIVHVKRDPTLLERTDSEGQTPLMHAVQCEQFETARILIKMGAAINKQSGHGRTVLSMAAYQGWHDGVVFLLRNGCKKNIPDKHGRYPLHAATYPRGSKVVHTLIQNMSQDEINLQDYEGMSALSWSCFHSSHEQVQVLLAHSADILALDVDGKSCLHWAAQNGSIKCTQELLRHDEVEHLINLPDFSGKTPLHFAASSGHHDTVRILLKIDYIIINCTDPDGRTPLHWASASGHVKCVSLLLSNNARADLRDADKCTPLTYSRMARHEECARLLVKNMTENGVDCGMNNAVTANIGKISPNGEHSWSKKTNTDLLRSMGSGSGGTHGNGSRAEKKMAPSNRWNPFSFLNGFLSKMSSVGGGGESNKQRTREGIGRPAKEGGPGNQLSNKCSAPEETTEIECPESATGEVGFGGAEGAWHRTSRSSVATLKEIGLSRQSSHYASVQLEENLPSFEENDAHTSPLSGGSHFDLPEQEYLPQSSGSTEPESARSVSGWESREDERPSRQGRLTVLPPPPNMTELWSPRGAPPPVLNEEDKLSSVPSHRLLPPIHKKQPLPSISRIPEREDLSLSLQPARVVNKEFRKLSDFSSEAIPPDKHGLISPLHTTEHVKHDPIGKKKKKKRIKIRKDSGEEVLNEGILKLSGDGPMSSSLTNHLVPMCNKNS